MIYFDNAATSGVKPKGVIAAVKNALEQYSANPGRSGYETSFKTAEMVYITRKKLAHFFGAENPESVVFTLNCTHAVNCVLKGIVHKGEHVVVSSLEHNAVMRPLKKMGVAYSVAQVSFDDDNKTIENFRKSIKPNTKLVLCTGASNVLGKTLPISAIGELCKKNKKYFAVDAAQIAGVVPIDMKRQNIDFLCVAPHKGLYAPMGTGILIARKNLPETIIEGGTGTNSIELYQPDELPERLESGTVNVPGIAGISAGVDYVNKIGIDRIYAHEMSLIRRLYAGLKKMSEITLYTPEPKNGFYAPVLSFNVKGVPSDETVSLLSKQGIAVRGGLQCAPSAHSAIGTLDGGTVRVSVGTFNTEREIDTFLQILNRKIIKNS